MSSLDTNAEVDSVLLQIRQLVSNNQRNGKAKPSDVIFDDETRLLQAEPAFDKTSAQDQFHLDNDLDHIDPLPAVKAEQPAPVARKLEPVTSIEDYQTTSDPEPQNAEPIAESKSRLKSLISWGKSKSERSQSKAEEARSASVLDNAMENRLDQVFFRPNAPQEATQPAPISAAAPAPAPQELRIEPAPQRAPSERKPQIRSLVAPQPVQPAASPIEEQAKAPEMRPLAPTEPEQMVQPIEAPMQQPAEPVLQVNVVKSRDIQDIQSPSVLQNAPAAVQDDSTDLTSFSDLKAAMSREVGVSTPTPAEAEETQTPLSEAAIEALVPASVPEADAGFATFSSRRAAVDAETEALEALMSATPSAPVQEPLVPVEATEPQDLALETTPAVDPVDTTTMLVADMLEETVAQPVTSANGLQRIESVADILQDEPAEQVQNPVEVAVQSQVNDLIEAELASKLGVDVANAVKLLIQQEVRAATEGR